MIARLLTPCYILTNIPLNQMTCKQRFTDSLQIRLMLDIHSFKFSKILEGIIHDIVHVLVLDSFLLFQLTHHLLASVNYMFSSVLPYPRCMSSGSIGGTDISHLSILATDILATDILATDITSCIHLVG
jgi:hypothetical protein